MSRIRIAGPTDAAGLAALIERATAELEEARGGRALLGDPVIDGALRATDHPQSVVWAASVGEKLVGAAAGWIEADRGWFVLFVHPDARRAGSGLALTEAVIGWLRMNGAASVDAVSLPGDRPTKQLLEKLGFKARLLIMREGG